ncbi:NAD-dependent epimerase/dehydratase family protein [Myxosarcina sp. GI1]|uniref:NAD-dependent epimerase/dehydratase family protein n=1 Tax=Myxosarcina sp. GI1 TaxID=1541065 RepID=UPI00056D4758|nr:NAD-dependent epimerase/dehydratase family protein [Myxosarcina sp. GI1]
MKVLITGATGFIGSRLIPRLERENNCQLYAAIRHQQQLPTTVTPIVVGEIDGNTEWNQALKDIDTVVHLAGRAHVLDEKAANPAAEFIRVNIEGTANLVRQAIKAGVKHFIFISSIGAMTTLCDRLLTEDYPPNPDTPYGRSKLKAEKAIVELTKNSYMTWTILRPTLVYGKGNPGNMASLVKLVRTGLPLPFGAIKNRRSFLYVGNLVDAIAVCLAHPQAKNRMFLIGDNQILSTPELIQIIARNLDRRSFLLPIPASILKLLGYMGDGIENFWQKFPFNSTAVNRLLGSLAIDNSDICQTLNWKPPYTTESGLTQDFS